MHRASQLLDIIQVIRVGTRVCCFHRIYSWCDRNSPPPNTLLASILARSIVFASLMHI